MDSSFNTADVSTGVPSEPKELVLYVKGLAMTTMARVSDGVDAMGKDFWIVVVDSGGGRDVVVASHKRISITNNLMIGWLSSIRIDPPVPIN